MMRVKMYRTERGAAKHMERVQAIYPELHMRLATQVGLDFRTYHFVQVLIDDIWMIVA